jgi:hypothetical protein
MAKGRKEPSNGRLLFLTRMFDRLVETGFRALAASVSGISVGLFLTLSARLVQVPVDIFVALIGAALMGISSILMACAIAIAIFAENHRRCCDWLSPSSRCRPGESISVPQPSVI